MRRCTQSFTFGEALRHWVVDETGGTGLLLVLGATLVMLVIASTVAGQARQELRMGTAETEAAMVEALVNGAFNEAARKAQDIPNWPDGDSELSDGKSLCNADPSAGGSYPSFCRQVLPSRVVSSTTLGNVIQIPVRVVWKASRNSDMQATYGWILLDSGTNAVLGVWYYHHWCQPDPTYPGSSPLGPCKQGS